MTTGGFTIIDYPLIPLSFSSRESHFQAVTTIKRSMYRSVTLLCEFWVLGQSQPFLIIIQSAVEFSILPGLDEREKRNSWIVPAESRDTYTTRLSRPKWAIGNNTRFQGIFPILFKRMPTTQDSIWNSEFAHKHACQREGPKLTVVWM